MDYMFKEKNLNFDLDEDREKESRLQQLFGRNKEETKYIEFLNKETKVIKMDYFRDLPTWQLIEKMPAKYFFDFKDVKNTDGTDYSLEDIDTLFKSGILKEEIALVEDKMTTNYSFTRKDDLIKISEKAKIQPEENETIEQYIARTVKIFK